MDTTLLLYLNGEWKSLDLYEDIPISLVIQETDITDFQGRKSPFSKQFTVPGTNNNALIFEHYYEVNGTEFDPLVKIEAVVQYRGTDIFNGVCRLQSVIVTEDYVDYEIYIMGDVGDFISEIKDKTLRDLFWDDLQHEQDYDNIVTSWSATTNETDGLLGGRVIYPMINWGLSYDTGSTPSFEFSFSGSNRFSQSSKPVPPSYFKPAIRIYEVVKRIFEQTTFELQSDFFETDYFKSIYMDTFVNGKLGIDVASGVSNQNLFVSYTPNKYFNYSGNNNLKPLTFSDSLPGASDPLNNFFNGIVGTFRAPYQGLYGFNVRMNYESKDILQINGDIAVVVYTGTSPNNLTTKVYEGTHYEIGIRGVFPPTLQKGSINEFFSLNMVPGQYVGVFIEEFDNYGAIGFSSPRGSYILSAFNSGGVTDPFLRWDLYLSPTLSGTQLVDFKLGVPDWQCDTFLKSLIQLFNLVIVTDEPRKTIKIEPYNSYYNEDDRSEKDWTQKLDLTSSYKVEPLSFELSKELVWTYTKGSEEFLNKTWEDTYNYNYGRYKYVSSSNLLTDTQTYELPFAPLPTSGLTGGDNFIIPQVWRNLNNQQSPYASKNHLFFWSGNRYCYTDSTKQNQSQWYMLSGATAVAQTTYPCVSHLSSLDIYNPNFVSDLNFSSNFDFFYSGNPYSVQSTPYTLYNSFWTDYIDNTYSNETRRFTGRFYLEPINVYDTSLTDKIYVKDSFYRIEKINEANLIQPDFVEVQLIKERGGYYQIDPPTPYYFISPNQAYPAPPSPVAIPSYTGETTGPVCSGTSSTGSVYISGTPPFSDGEYVYSYDGAVYTPLPYGTNVRWTGTTDTYVVINNIGQIIQIDC